MWHRFAEQQTAPNYGYLFEGARPVYCARSMKDYAGYVAGRTLAFEYRWAEGRNDRLPVLAAELVRRLGVSLGLIVSALDVLGAQQALAPIESTATASQLTLTCTFIPNSSCGLPA